MVFFERTPRKTWTESLVVFLQELFTIGTVGGLLIFVATASYSVNEKQAIEFTPFDKKTAAATALFSQSLGFKKLDPGQGEFSSDR